MSMTAELRISTWRLRLSRRTSGYWIMRRSISKLNWRDRLESMKRK
jgi:hypothetical protein